MATFGTDPQAQRPGGLGPAVLAGIGVAVGGSLVWGLIAYLTKYQFSLMALLMGLAIGTVVVRVAGGARSPGLAVACAVLAVLGCALGSFVAEVLALLGHGIPASLILAHLDLVLRAYPSAVGALGFVFWALGAFYGYRIAMGAPVWRRRARPGLPQADGQQYGQWPQPGGTVPAGTDSQQYGQWPQPGGSGAADGQQYGVPAEAGGTAPADPAAGQRLFFAPPPESPAAGNNPAGPDLSAGTDLAAPDRTAGTDLAAGTDPAGPPPSAPEG
jgi:hypothetical protein